MAVNAKDQASCTGGALVFCETPLAAGTAITHVDGAPEIRIAQSGIYQATFHGTVAFCRGTSTVTVQLLHDSIPVPGAASSHTASGGGEVVNVSFTALFRAAGPGTLKVVASASGFTFSNIALSVFRLGDSA